MRRQHWARRDPLVLLRTMKHGCLLLLLDLAVRARVGAQVTRLRGGFLYLFLFKTQRSSSSSSARRNRKGGSVWTVVLRTQSRTIEKKGGSGLVYSNLGHSTKHA